MYTLLKKTRKHNKMKKTSYPSTREVNKYFDLIRCTLSTQTPSRESTHTHTHREFVLTWHFSLVMGFCVKPLLEALVFTGNSSTPQTSLKRYIKTYLYLAEWHLCGDMFDPSTRAFQSVQTVRKIHDTVRGNMEKDMPKQKWMTQYDMCLVQTGFMGSLVVTPHAFGMHLNDSEVDDYVYFWKCVARQLGVMDTYNLCGVDYKTSESITWEVIDKVVIPSEVTVPEPDYDTIVSAYVDGANSVFPCLKLWSLRAMNAYTYHCLGQKMPGPKLSCSDSLRLLFYKTLMFLLRWAPGVALLGNAVALCATYALIRNDDGRVRDTEGGSCPVVGTTTCNTSKKKKKKTCPASSFSKRRQESRCIQILRGLVLLLGSIGLLLLIIFWILVVVFGIGYAARLICLYLFC